MNTHLYAPVIARAQVPEVRFFKRESYVSKVGACHSCKNSAQIGVSAITLPTHTGLCIGTRPMDGARGYAVAARWATLW